MEYSTTVDVAAPPERVWQVMSDVERWPEWTSSVRSVHLLSPGPLAVGSRVRVSQPRLPTTVWTVSELVDGESFTWVATGPGLRTVADHSVAGTPGGCRVTLSVLQAGALGGLMGRLLGGLTERYLDLEAGGLKARAQEQPPPA